MKTCICCKGTKPYEEFYKHPYMADGYLGRCKECQKALSKARDKEKVRAYDRQRAKFPSRKASQLEAQRIRRAKYPQKEKARMAVCRARKNGKLVPKPCIICQNPNSEAHHPDYGKKLEVIWMCFEHHRALHGGILCLLLE